MSVQTYDEAVREKAQMIGLVRELLDPDLSDEEIWSHWKELLRRRPTSAFECCRSLNILAKCDRLADAGVPDSVLQPIRDHAFGGDLSDLKLSGGGEAEEKNSPSEHGEQSSSSSSTPAGES